MQAFINRLLVENANLMVRLVLAQFRHDRLL